MSDDRGFRSDAAYFDLVAAEARDPSDRRALRNVANTYRTLAEQWGPRQRLVLHRSRRELWLDRAEECRTLRDQFKNDACRHQLQRLAEAYEMMAGYESASEPPARNAD